MYKPLRQEFREFADYLGRHPQQNADKQDFLDSEVPEHILEQFQKLYDNYTRLNSSDKESILAKIIR